MITTSTSFILGGVGGTVAMKALDANPLNFGTYGNGHPQMGVVTGNLGGSLGLGGKDSCRTVYMY